MRRVAILVYPGYSVMALAAVSVFETANLSSADPIYSLDFMSETGGPVRTSVGLTVDSTPLSDAGGNTLLVGGGAFDGPPPAALLAYLRAAPGRFRRIASICTGAFVLASAGLLDGRRVTTHWANAGEFQAAFPAAQVESDRIFLRDGPFWTSAGMSAGIDLALQLVEDDHGESLAKTVSRKLVLYHRRGGGQSQFSSLLELSPKSDRIHKALTYARANLRRPLTVPDLAAAAHLSPRQFARSFQTETGQTPAKAIERLRADVARDLIEDTGHPIDEIARQTGFSDSNHMRRAFLRVFGQPPQAMRRLSKV